MKNKYQPEFSINDHFLRKVNLKKIKAIYFKIIKYEKSRLCDKPFYNKRGLDFFLFKNIYLI